MFIKKALKMAAIVPMLGATLALSACNITAADVATIIQDVQADTAAACSVIPDADSIIALFANNPVVESVDLVATSIAEAICSGVAAAGPLHVAHHFDSRVPRTHDRLTPPPITINGVVVHFL